MSMSKIIFGRDVTFAEGMDGNPPAATSFPV